MEPTRRFPRSNCNFMELKLVSQMHMNYAQASSNCTFMELK